MTSRPNYGGTQQADHRRQRSEHRFAAAAKHQRAGRLHEAERSYKAILAEEPRNVAALNNLGRVQQALGKPAEAAVSYRRAVAIAPNEPRLLANLGNALSEQGAEAEAEIAYRQALALQPGMAEAHNNLGSIFHRAGDLDRAAGRYQDAIALNPAFAEPHGNLARLRLAEGDVATALHFARQFLKLAPGRDAQRLLVRCVRELQPQPRDLELRPLVECALTEGWDRPAELAAIAGRLICLTTGGSDDIDATMAALASDTLLAALLVVTPVATVELERLLTRARRHLLHNLDAASERLLPFACLLAQQCFLNEYVFARTDAEDSEVVALREPATHSPLGLAVLASYEPLYGLQDAASLLDRAWPDPVRQLLRQQVSEPLAEAGLRASIRTLGTVDDAVSQAVRRQYEENPYPRWTRPAPAEPVPSLDHLLRRQFPASPFLPLRKAKAADVLIAGCGTGRQPIEVARQLPGSRVLAIDLSLASLAYARRKARELGATDVEFAQADLLRCSEFGRNFDVIQATGVLHHLGDPMAGWRALAAILRPCGVMQIGLYSELARQPVVAARQYIAERGFRPVADDIRRCRQELLASTDGSMDWVAESRDCFYLSACRDLLFHVQESRLTLPRISEFLTQSGLIFLGFELEPAIANAYRSHNPRDKAMTDLAAWHTFEMRHSEAFRGMYQFWVQKPD